MILFVYSVICPIFTINMLKTKLADGSAENKSSHFIGNVVKGNKTAKMPIKLWLDIAFELSPVGMF